MIIKSLELKNFRNYGELCMEFSNGTNILFGDNAQGKTNILESLYVCATSKSHKGSKDREMIQFKQNESHIRTVIEKNSFSNQIDIHLKKNSAKGIAVNQVPIRKASELFGILNIIFFSPEDLNIIKNGPSQRRRFLDMELSQLDKIYLFNITKYNKILIQRNKLLKDISFRPDLKDTLEVWDEQLADYGSKVIVRRKQFTEELNGLIFQIHNKISGMKEEIVLKYEADTKAEEFRKSLSDSHERDLKTFMTTVGPHRDDISFIVNDTDIRKYGSQGQQRTAALSLKLAEIELVKSKINDTPVLLLDDVLSELDSNRQCQLLNSINDIQTIITCTGLDEFIKTRFQINKVFSVTEGTVSEY